MSCQAEAETNDNLQFLSTLLPWFEKLHYATKSAEMVAAFSPLMHTLYLVWVYSRFVLSKMTGQSNVNPKQIKVLMTVTQTLVLS